MRISKKLRAVLVTVLAVVIVASSVLAVAAAGGWLPSAWGAKSTTVKYEKPTMNEVAGEGVEPEAMEPETSAISTEKEWYEYITYSAEPLEEVSDGKKTKIKFYDPYDYNYGTIMEISDTNVATYKGEEKLTIPCAFSSANELSVTWSTSKVEGSEWASEIGGEFQQSWEYGVGLVGTTSTTGFSIQIGHTQAGSKETEQGVELSQTFSAVHCNASGVPYQWKVVKYTVYMPFKVEIHKTDSKGQYFLDETRFILVPTVQGTCREYIMNGVTYIEDWRTGDGMPLDDFWDDFMTPAKLKKLYNTKLMPK